MGRSQVLYNRTKGRYKNKRGQQSQEQLPQQSSQTTNKGGNAGRGFHRSSRPSAGSIPHQPQPQPTHSNNTGKQHVYRPKIDESVLLNSSSKPFVASTPKPLDEVSGSIFNQGNNASNSSYNSTIDIQSMAATMSMSLKVSQRLRVPPYVAQALFHSSAYMEQRQAEESSLHNNLVGSPTNDTGTDGELNNDAMNETTKPQNPKTPKPQNPN